VQATSFVPSADRHSAQQAPYSAPQQTPPVLAAGPDYSKFGGWMIVLLILFITRTLMSAVVTALTLPLTVLGWSYSAHRFTAVESFLIWAEWGAYVLAIIAGILFIVWLLLRNTKIIFAFIATGIAEVILSIFAVVTLPSAFTLGGLVGIIAFYILWGWYLNKSVRVKGYFGTNLPAPAGFVRSNTEPEPIVPIPGTPRQPYTPPPSNEQVDSSAAAESSSDSPAPEAGQKTGESPFVKLETADDSTASVETSVDDSGVASSPILAEPSLSAPVELSSAIPPIVGDGTVIFDGSFGHDETSEANPNPAHAMPEKELRVELTLASAESDISLTFSPSDVQTVLGRSADESDAVVDDARASRRHCKLTINLENGSLSVADLGSSNGTYLNGEKIIDTQTLQDGDMLRIGRTEYTVKL